MYTFPVHNKTVSVFSSANPGTPVIYLDTFSNEGQQVFQTAQDAGCPPFTLVAVSDLNWNHDMTPWDSPSVFKNAPPCTGGGNDYIRLLIEEIMPEAEKKVQQSPNGEELPDTLWRVCSPFTPFIKQIYFSGWPAYPAPSGFRE